MVETLLAAVLVAAMLTVVVVAYAALRAIHLLGQVVGAQAEAVTRVVDLGQAQRRDAVRPVLAVAVRALEANTEPTAARFGLDLTNAGTGPAFDVVVTLVGMPTLAEAPGSASSGASPALVMVGQTLTLDFTRPEPSQRGSRHAWPREAQPVGEVLLAFRDSFNGARTTRARLATTRWLEDSGTYGLRVASQVFEE
jgi:hypothetical protein